MRIGGIDQCNKGECLGPVFVVVCYGDFKSFNDYKKIPYSGQSKTRTSFFIEYLDLYDLKFLCKKIEPVNIDKNNLNTLIFEKQKELIQELNLDLAYVDNHQKEDKFNNKNVITAHKMDNKETLTGLASLIAVYLKKQWKKEVEKELKSQIGSGNLADEKTKRYIINNYPNVKYLRKSWSLKSLGL